MTEDNEEVDSEEKIRRSYEYFLDKYQKNEGFTRNELFNSLDWGKSTFDTYFTKMFRNFSIKIEDKYYLTEKFRKYSIWKSYRKFFSQTKGKKQKYKVENYKNVIIYEFFMPLTNEGALKSALDALFYKDTLIRRFSLIPISEIEAKFQRKTNEEDNEYYDRIYEWISEKFVGFSISHCKGRFRIGGLKTFKEVAIIQEQAGRYIEDETTAIVKFIFPCGEQNEEQNTTSTFTQQEEELIRYFFEKVFVETILEVMIAEDEIWMLESGMRTKLHIWKTDN